MNGIFSTLQCNNEVNPRLGYTGSLVAYKGSISFIFIKRLINKCMPRALPQVFELENLNKWRNGSCVRAAGFYKILKPEVTVFPTITNLFQLACTLSRMYNH